VELDPGLLMLGQLRMPGVGVAVELEVDVARTCADVTAGDAPAAAVVREAMPKPSPARPASATPTKSSRLAIRHITISLGVDLPIRVRRGFTYSVSQVKCSPLGTPS
jgi:hypothetical protein